MANAAKAFIAQVESSHQAIQHCYEQALRTNADLAGHPTELAVVALFDAHGANTSTSTTPALGGAFDACFAQVAAKWTVTVPAAMTFKANVTLTPQ
jgi:hypothetical protein